MKGEKGSGRESKLEVNSSVDEILERYKFLTEEKEHEALRKKKTSEKEYMKPGLDYKLMDRVDAILEKYKFLKG